LLGGVTEDAQSFFSRFSEYVTAEHAKHLSLALCNEFKDDRIVMLDIASYFRASEVRELAVRDDLEPSNCQRIDPT
jgi:hypothetical protein